MQQEKRLDAGDSMALVVARAAAVEKTIADQAAEVAEVRTARGRTVAAGEIVLVLRPL